QLTGQKTAFPLTGWTDAERKGTIYWDDAMKQPILVSGSKVWIVGHAGGELIAEMICSVLAADGLLSFVKYDRNSGLLFAGTQSKGIIVIRRNGLRPMRKADLTPDEPTAYYSQ